MKEMFAKRFKKEFPKKRLLAIRLNGFSHTVVLDEGNARTLPQYLAYSAYLSSSEVSDKKLNDSLANIFEGFSHYAYQGNPTEIMFVLPNER